MTFRSRKMSQPANDDFSQHLSDDEASYHEDAIKMEHYVEYIDNDVWKVIQNGNSKKRISTGKDGVVRILPPVSAVEIHAVEKERKARTILLMAIPKEHLRRFYGMDDAKEICEAIRTRFGGNANSKKMQKAILKQQFEAFTISSSEGLEKGYDRFQQLLSQLEAHGAEVSTEDANHKFLRSLPLAWSNLAMTMRTKPDVDTLSIDDLYNNLRVFEQELTSTSKSSASAQNVTFVSHSKSSNNKVKSRHTAKFYKKRQKREFRNSDGNKPVVLTKRKLNVLNVHNTSLLLGIHIQGDEMMEKERLILSKINELKERAESERVADNGDVLTIGRTYSIEERDQIMQLIDCDFYEKKMAREAELKKQRVFDTGKGVVKPVLNNANWVNHANQFIPRPVQLNTGRANINSVRPNVNTGSSTQEHGGQVGKATSTNSVNSGNGQDNTQPANQDDSDMPELTIFNKPRKGIFDEASYDDEGSGLMISTIYNIEEVPLSSKDSKGTITKINRIICLLASILRRNLQKISEALKMTVRFVKALYDYITRLPRACIYSINIYQEAWNTEGTIQDFIVKNDRREYHAISMYVDDIILAATRNLVKQKTDGIFISQDKYVADMLKKFDFTSVKTTITLMETKMALTKDKEADEVDVHLYKSMIGNPQLVAFTILEAINTWQCKKQTLCRPLQHEVRICSYCKFCDSMWISESNVGNYGFNFHEYQIHIEYNECPAPTQSALSEESGVITPRINAQLNVFQNTWIALEHGLKVELFFGNIKRGFRGVPRPLLPAMFPVVAVDQSAGPADQVEDQPSSSTPLPSSSHPPMISTTIASEPTPVAKPTTHHTSPSPEPDNEHTEHIFEQPSPEHQPLSPRQETKVPQSQDPTHPHVLEARNLIVEDLLHLVPNLITKGDSLEIELKKTKLTMDKAIMKLVRKVKKLEDILKMRHVVLTDSEDEEPEDQGRIIQDINDDPLISKGDFVASQRLKSVDKGKRYKRRKESKGEDISTTLKKLILALKKLILEEETAKQVHLDALLAKRMEEEELTEQQKQRKAQNVLGKELPEEDFAKKMVELVNQRKKFFAEERAKARRSKPMTQSLLRNYMMNYLKNQGTWKLTQLKKLSFEEVKEEFDKLVKQVESFVPMNIEATKAQLKRYGEELQTEISKKQRIDDKDVSVEEKVTEVKEEEPVIRTGKRKKQKARKGINVDKSPQGDSETDEEESVEAMNPTPLDTKSNIVANWKIFQQGERSIYQIIRANGADTVYMSFGAMLKDFTREDLIELYRLVMQKYGTNRPEDVYDRVLWSDLRTMFDPPLNEDAIWSLPLQQKIISWRYYDKCEVHCLTLEACSIYMLADRKYPLSKDACQVMLKMKLLDGKMNEVCYKLLKMIEKQAGVRK
ncbi:hypothetical protein Tco_0860648 [Tanacetum coccineum]|uniref:Reverse transcriptase Ty1/copia-type domain-containing protein n=1 Tax=Tanacetum coccineum TaxID=301880 RepID=A0ABQ5BIX9_9ASTR